jgi:hypothetical protein
MVFGHDIQFFLAFGVSYTPDRFAEVMVSLEHHRDTDGE